jgi:uncharacterized protein YrrD
MSDPVSWLMVESGWKVVDRDGDEVGKVEEIVGDTNRDIFNGLTIGVGLLKRGRYVPAERIAVITEGEVRLALDKDQVERLGEYEEPPPSKRVLPE